MDVGGCLLPLPLPRRVDRSLVLVVGVRFLEVRVVVPEEAGSSQEDGPGNGLGSVSARIVGGMR